MSADGITIPRARLWGLSDLAWLAAIAGALLLPVQATATWLHGTYTATPAALVAGTWMFKASVVVLALGVLLVRRVPEPGPTRSASNGATQAEWLLFGAIAVLAIALRVYRFDTEPWPAEIYLRTRYAPLEFRQLISTYDTQNHQPFYSILAKLSFLVSGSDWSLRIPSVLLGVASLWAVWRFGRRVTTGAEALLGALILAVSYHHVWFSQNARGYTAMLLFAVLGTHLFLDLCNGGGRRTAWTYAVLMALATYTHMTAALIVVGHAVALIITTKWTSRTSRATATWPAMGIVLSGLLSLTLYALMLPQVWLKLTTPTMEGVEVEWTGIGWMVREAVRVLSEGIPGGILTVLVAVGVMGVGLLSYWRQSRITTLAMTLPILVTLVTIVAAGHNLWPRFFFFGAGFIVLLALRGGFVIVNLVVRRQGNMVAVAGACAVALLSLITVPRAWLPKQQFRAAMDYVEEQRRPGDGMVALDVAGWVYLLRGWGNNWGFTTSQTMLGDSERTVSRTWVVYTLPARLKAVAPEVFEHVSTPRYRVVRTFPATVGGGEIQVLLHDSSNEHD